MTPNPDHQRLRQLCEQLLSSNTSPDIVEACQLSLTLLREIGNLQAIWKSAEKNILEEYAAAFEKFTNSFKPCDIAFLLKNAKVVKTTFVVSGSVMYEGKE